MAWTLPKTWSVGEVVTAANMNTHLRDNLNALRWASAKITADQSVNNTTTLTNVTGMAIAIGVSETWAFLGGFLYSSVSGSPDIDFAFTGPSGSAISWSAPGSETTAGAFKAPVSVAAGARVNAGADATVRNILALGTIVNSTNTGNLQLQFSQDTPVAENTTIKAGSWLVALRLA